MYTRKHLKFLKNRVLEGKKFIQAVLGPRQVGKTTLAKQLTREIDIPYLYVSADAVPASNTSWIDQQWEAARLKLKTSGAAELVFIVDEIQKVENWSEAVKAQWDKDAFDDIPIKVVVLGSSRLILHQGLTESLTGRFEVIPMTHWSYEEMQEAFGFSLYQYIWFGGYPGAAQLINDENRWRDYILNAIVETTISKDVFMLSRIEKPALLKRLFELGCAYSGQIVSFNKLLGQLQDAGNTTTLAHYLQLLDWAGLLAGLQKYSKEKVRQRASSPKWQVYNSALFTVLSNRKFQQTLEMPERWGRHVETAAGAHLLNRCIESGINIYYWRDRNDEVDFILEKEGRLAALEIKSGTLYRPRGMSVFQQRHNPHKVYLIGSGGIPLEEFFSYDPVDLF